MHTKNDLSYNKVKLDYEALQQTANIAVGMLLQQSSDYINKMRNTKCDTELHLTAEYLKSCADSLVVACETLATIRGIPEREEIEIVNK